MRIGALNTGMSDTLLIVVDSEADAVGRVDGRPIWRLRTNSTLVVVGPEKMGSILGKARKSGWRVEGQGERVYRRVGSSVGMKISDEGFWRRMRILKERKGRGGGVGGFRGLVWFQ
jgi:hypothetical protein